MTENKLAEYRRSQVMGMSQVELVITLYSGAIRFLNEAIDTINAERFDQSWKKFDRARKIVIHLLGTLNLEAGDLASKFASLYAYVIEQISEANARRDVAKAQECIDVLMTLKEGWDGLAAQSMPEKLKVETPVTNSVIPSERAQICVDA